MQAAGPAKEKDRSPNLSLVLGTSNRWLLADRMLRREDNSDVAVTSSVRYVGLHPIRMRCMSTHSF